MTTHERASERTDTERLDWMEERWVTLIAPPDQTGEDYHGIDNEWAVRGPYGEVRQNGIRAAIDAGIALDGWKP
jgi:hypothetical protein